MSESVCGSDSRPSQTLLNRSHKVDGLSMLRHKILQWEKPISRDPKAIKRRKEYLPRKKTFWSD